MGILNYSRHFGLLAISTGVLAVTRRWNPASGIVAEFGMYGALHAAAVSLTLRAPQPAARKLRFVAIGASLSVLSVLIGMGASRAIGGPTGMTQAAIFLSLSAGLGAAAYASIIRVLLGALLRPSAIVAIVLGCICAPLAVLKFGGYPKGGLWIASSWWFAMSLGLWFGDARGSCLPQFAKDGTIGRS